MHESKEDAIASDPEALAAFDESAEAAGVA